MLQTLFSDERTQEAPSRRLRKALGLVDPNPVPSQLQENTYFHLQDICICSFCICGLLHLLIFARNFCSLLQCNLTAFANFYVEVLLFFALEALPIVWALKAVFGLPFLAILAAAM